MSKTVTTPCLDKSPSTMQRPNPCTPPVTITFLPRSSISVDHSLRFQQALDFSYTLHHHDLVKGKLKAERLLQQHYEFHMFQGIPCFQIAHGQIVGDPCRR